MENTNDVKAFNIESIHNMSVSKKTNALSFDKSLYLVDSLTDADCSAIFSASPMQVCDHVMILCIGGHLHFKVNFRDEVLNTDAVMYLRPGDVAQLQEATDAKIVMLMFDETFTGSISSEVALLLMQLLSNSQCVTVDSRSRDFLLKTYHEIRGILEMQDFQFKELAVKGIIQIAMAFGSQWVWERMKTGEMEKDFTRQHKIFDRFLKLVLENYMSERSVSFYANEMCITPKYLSMIVAKESGKYAVDWIRDQVIFKAKALLRSRQYTVQQVADMLHFPNPSFFGKYFKQVVGIPPRQYMVS